MFHLFSAATRLIRPSPCKPQPLVDNPRTVPVCRRSHRRPTPSNAFAFAGPKRSTLKWRTASCAFCCSCDGSLTAASAPTLCVSSSGSKARPPLFFEFQRLIFRFFFCFRLGGCAVAGQVAVAVGQQPPVYVLCARILRHDARQEARRAVDETVRRRRRCRSDVR